MSTQPVRDAYSSLSQQYIDLFDGDWQTFEDETALVRDHLVGVDGRVLDLGCGPGHWTAYLHAHGADVTGVDLVPEFVAYARESFPGPEFRLGSMTELGLPDRSVAGILSWYSTIHLPPEELDEVLAEFQRMLTPAGRLVIGFFDSDDTVAAFDHAVHTAYRWPVDEFSARLVGAGFIELRRLRQRFPDRPDRRYAAIAAGVS
ncbi:class I SAM-dependent methyltransferase [Catenuloplanes sp. NPDC051500]|uniref:class I SAM-dependent methyltransferase n=1 Tax=Catenuloplanes sp. NPDC051500 TaxID=3363959 RepID=UPI0037B55629